MLDRAGQVLGNYKLLRLLGQGGFSDVYLAEHIHLNTYAAIKILHMELAGDNLENFRIEARTLAHLRHPNIVQVLDFGVAGMMPYLVMQYALNGTLRQRHPGGMPVALNVVVSYVKSMAAALQYAHNQKLIHRDVKPENMLIGEQNQILLSDFGIAVVDASSRQAGTSFNPMGTITYMAPEQIQGKMVPASDQYALAIVVYEWLTGALPFNGSYTAIMSQQISTSPTPLREKVPSIPVAVEQVVMLALDKDPQKRFKHIEAFAQALAQASQIEQEDIVASHQKNSSEVSTMEATLISSLGRTVLGATKVTIGRAPDNTLVLADARVSPYHAEVRPAGSDYILANVSQGDRVFVNGQLVYNEAPRQLQTSDIIRVGDTELRFMMDSGAQNASSGQYPPMSTTIPSQQPFNMPNYQGNPAGYYAGTPPPPVQYPVYSDAPTYISGNGAPGQPPSYTPNQSGGQLPNYTPNQSGGQPPNYPPNYSGGQPPAPPQRSSPMRVIVLGVIAAIVIIAGVSGFVVYHNNQIAQSHIYATATAQTQAHNQATATVVTQQNTTATAVANTSLTATAVATSPYMPFAKVGLDDSLMPASPRWDTSSICQNSATGYQVSIVQNQEVQFCTNSGQYGEIAYQVSMTIHQGDCGGMVFRYIDANNLYFFKVCQNGTYDLGDYVKGNLVSLGTQTGNTQANSAIQQGVDAHNVIAITVQGDTINMYVNGTRIDTETNPDLTNSMFSHGQIGLLADDEGNPTSVIYTNALVWTI